jgi:hypothetical protein
MLGDNACDEVHQSLNQSPDRELSPREMMTIRNQSLNQSLDQELRPSVKGMSLNQRLNRHRRQRQHRKHWLRRHVNVRKSFDVSVWRHKGDRIELSKRLLVHQRQAQCLEALSSKKIRLLQSLMMTF